MSALISIIFLLPNGSNGQKPVIPSINVPLVKDFECTGKGNNEAWSKADWIFLKSFPEDSRITKCKTVYSETGIYFLYFNEDSVINATKTDFEQLWLEDVVEVFLWPSTTLPLYIEYQLSPINKELLILIPRINGNHMGWRPWYYENERKTRHAISKEANGWYAEFYIPFAVFNPLENVPPKKGTKWRGNMYRVDYDQKDPHEWSWNITEKTFHETDKFGELIFQ